MFYFKITLFNKRASEKLLTLMYQQFHEVSHVCLSFHCKAQNLWKPPPVRKRSGEVSWWLFGQRNILFLIWFKLCFYVCHHLVLFFLATVQSFNKRKKIEFCVNVVSSKTGKDSSPLTDLQHYKNKMYYSPSQTVVSYPFAGIMFGEVWLPAQEFPWKWIQGFSPFSPLKVIHQTAPEENTRHGVSCIAIKKNDFAAQQSAQ